MSGVINGARKVGEMFSSSGGNDRGECGDPDRSKETSSICLEDATYFWSTCQEAEGY